MQVHTNPPRVNTIRAHINIRRVHSPAMAVSSRFRSAFFPLSAPFPFLSFPSPPPLRPRVIFFVRTCPIQHRLVHFQRVASLIRPCIWRRAHVCVCTVHFRIILFLSKPADPFRRLSRSISLLSDVSIRLSGRPSLYNLMIAYII